MNIIENENFFLKEKVKRLEKALEFYAKAMEKENARLRKALEKITEFQPGDGNDMLGIAYKALKQGKEE